MHFSTIIFSDELVIIRKVFRISSFALRRPDIPTHPKPASPPLDGLAGRVEELRRNVQPSDPFELAARCAVLYLPNDPAAPESHGDTRGEFHLETWGKPIRILYPELIAQDALSGQELPSYLQAMVLYYLATCDGTPGSGQWIAFSELPDGRFYAQAFQGYTGAPLAQAFGEDLTAFSQAAERCSGERRHSFGDMAYAFQALPQVALLVVFWRGDEDFPSTCQVLFDASVSHHLPTDACAILGSQLTRRLIKAKS